MRRLLFWLLLLSFMNTKSQIIIDNSQPYNIPTYLLDNVLVRSGKVKVMY